YAKPRPSSMPTPKASQNQRLNVAPATIAMPTVTTAVKAARPIHGFGKPKAEPCHDCITLPQLITGFRSQFGGKLGFWRSFSLSRLTINEQMMPITPPIISKYGIIRGSFCSGSFWGGIPFFAVAMICLKYTIHSELILIVIPGNSFAGDNVRLEKIDPS